MFLLCEGVVLLLIIDAPRNIKGKPQLRSRRGRRCLQQLTLPKTTSRAGDDRASGKGKRERNKPRHVPVSRTAANIPSRTAPLCE
jgi:hypothetical protein